MKHIIDFNDWDLTYTELVQWSNRHHVDVYCVNAIGGNGIRLYAFEKDEDLVLFKLTFKRIKFDD